LGDALHPLLFWYPECPLRFLDSYPAESVDQHILHATVARLLNREDRKSMMTQATAVWLWFDSGLLKVNPELVLARFPEIERYPDTELSQQVAGSIRASLNAFYTKDNDEVRAWPIYFWNRGIEIAECRFHD
jgi:hypothetical protein